MNLCHRILQTIIEAEVPISTYKIAKLLNESFNAVKYNMEKLENHKTILAIKRSDKPKATYYVPNVLYTETDAILDSLEPIIIEVLETSDFNQDNAKFNFKMLFELLIEDLNNGKSTKKG